MGKYVQDKFKMKLTVVNTDGNNLQLMAASGELPDVMAAGLGDALFNQFKNDALIREIPDAEIEKYVNLKKMMEISDVTQAYKKMTGKYYSIPRLANADKPTKAMEQPMYYRADWAQKLGIANAPTTVDEYYQLLKAFAQNDPDGNKQNDTYGTSGWLWQVHFIPWVDMYNWVKEGGKWIPGYVSNNMLPALKFWNKLYQEKILDPEYSVAKAKDMFYTGKIGVLYAGGGDYWLWNIINVQFGGANPDLKPMEAVKLIPPLKMDAGSPQRWVKNVESQATLFSSKCDDEKLDRILEFFDWSLSPEGRDFSFYGFKDKDYLVKDGKVVSILPMKENVYGQQKPIWEVYPSVNLFNLVRWNCERATPELNPIYPQAIRDLTKQYQDETYGPNVVDVNIFVNNVSTPEKDKFNVGLGDIETEFGNIISSKNCEADFEAYRKKLLDVNGLQKVIDEVNQAVTQQGLDK
jgi:putative aldouronate transport system substrate-binding protein